MNKKKILSVLLTTMLIVGVSVFASKENNNSHGGSNKNIKVLNYKPVSKAETIKVNGFQIDKYENQDIIDWISDNEALTFHEQYVDSANFHVGYCSVYNLTTKTSKDYKNVEIANYMGISPDKKYVLYKEKRFVPEDKVQWQKELDSGRLLHANLKLLNLATGEITDVKTENDNKDAEFKWINNNAIMANYFDKWEIIDTTGKLLDQASYENNKYAYPSISGLDNIKQTDDGFEGRLYYTSSIRGTAESKLMSMDIKSKKIKTILPASDKYFHADEKSDTIIMDTTNNNGPANSKGVFENRTFGAQVLDTTGKVLRNIELPKGRIDDSKDLPKEYTLSPDGSKAVYIEKNTDIGDASVYKKKGVEAVLKVIDTKTGEVKNIVSAEDIEKQIQLREDQRPILTGDYSYFDNLIWSSDSNSLSFNYELGNKVNSYIVSFDNID
ncbi:hypothetical protein IAI10_12110 [Clostridium sp. 19966]|uniref:hypothetical protein n=1 Tax=Clostridium sp. 19966 TaxID=2768166 RepID=UPI0028DF0B6C|nr:hypothetical protein [Clostridium sp. 19966]MDT8717405.1 hypothetical protein [Clostridium sp. 19966]